MINRIGAKPRETQLDHCDHCNRLTQVTGHYLRLCAKCVVLIAEASKKVVDKT